MILSRNLFLFLLLIFPVKIFSQEWIPYYDKEKQKYGFQNKETRQIVVQPQYEDAVAKWKDYGIVRIEGKYGLIDKDGNKVSPFIHDYMFVEECADCHFGELAAFHYYRANYRSPRKFYINQNCDCIPKPFFPCPPMVKMDTSETPLHLKILQRAEKQYHLGEVKKSLEIADKAIEADSADASVWFWKATVSSDGWELRISDNPYRLEGYYIYECENQIESNANQIKYLMQRHNGEIKPSITPEEYFTELEKIQHEDSILQIDCKRKKMELDSLTLIYEKWDEQNWDLSYARFDTSYHLLKYYNAALRHVSKESLMYYSVLSGKHDLRYLPKSEKKMIAREIKEKLPRIRRKSEMGILLNTGYSFFPYQKLEANLTYGFSEFIFESAFPVMAGYGLGFEYGMDLSVQTYKAIVFANPVGAVHLSASVLYVRGFNNGGLGFRPEFGFSFSALTVLYGFNFVSDNKFPGARGNMVGVRLNLPVWRADYFSKNEGNNLYR